MIAARRAEAGDDATIAALRDLALSEVRERRGGDQFAATEAGIPPGRDLVTFVGTIDGDVVGVATVVRDGRRAFIPELFAHPGARDVGVGHALVMSIEDQAREWGCASVESWALPGDRETKNFFESHAMKARLLVVHRTL